jgi:uncharacterized protein
MLTPSKITAWLDCSHYLTLKRGDAERDHPGTFAQLLQDKGLQHEAECLAGLEAEGRSVFRVPEKVRGESFDAWVERVGNPLAEGHDVIYQMPFIHDGVRGTADFLLRVENPESGYSDYEPLDSKLARREAKPGHVLQLCFYAEAIEAKAGLPPKKMHLWLGSGAQEELVVDHYGAYWRRLKKRLLPLLEDQSASGATRPEPCTHCQFCEFQSTCEKQWRDEDSLIFLAGLRAPERSTLEAASIETIVKLSASEEKVDGVDPERFGRLREQAKLQVQGGDPPPFRLIEPDDDSPWGHGYDELPEPSEGDIFFDLEGHPYWTVQDGLFFLFGYWLKEGGEWVYDARWAHDLVEEADRVADAIELFEQRRAQYPDMHVYHYNHTERSSLERLTSGTELELRFAHLKRSGIFIDLLPVAQNAFQVGVESYGLKHLEKLASFVRNDEIHGGSGAVVAYEAYLEDHDQGHLDEIAVYNRDDVCATKALRDWLVDQRPEDREWREAVIPEDDEEALDEELIERLLGYPPGTREHLLGDLLGYWAREKAAVFPPAFEKLARPVDELLDERDCITGLRCVKSDEEQMANGNTRFTAEFTWPHQFVGSELDEENSFVIGVPGGAACFGTRKSIDRARRTLSLTWSVKPDEEPFFPVSAVAYDWVDPQKKPGAVAELAQRLLDPAPGIDPNPTSLALLDEAAAPSFIPGFSLPGGEFSDDPDDIVEMVQRLDQSAVAIQGPPGTGKTFRGALLIHALITAGKRVGISALSHAAIDNLLTATHQVFSDAGQLSQLSALRKMNPPDASRRLGGVKYSNSNSEASKLDPAGTNGFKYNLIAGTTWLFGTEAMRENPVDFLVIDEAGQLALADAVAASTSAKNVVLLGDPLQLPQVSKAAHPNHSGRSVLEHVLGDDVTIPPDRGVFLEETWRMHPDICGFISEQIYDGRLSSEERCSNQMVVGVGTGLRWIEADHVDRTNEALEEAQLVAAKITELLGIPWINRDGVKAPLAAADFMVVAPFNNQRRAIEGLLKQDPKTADIEVGTVDKFQGRQAAVVLYSLTSSSGDDAPRGLGFLLSRNRFNVAVSRARCLTFLFCTEELLNSKARNVEEMRLIGTLNAFVEAAAS